MEKQRTGDRTGATVRKASCCSGNEPALLPERRRNRGAYHLNRIFGETFLTEGTGHSLPKNWETELAVPFMSPFPNAVRVWVQIDVAANARQVKLCNPRIGA